MVPARWHENEMRREGSAVFSNKGSRVLGTGTPQKLGKGPKYKRKCCFVKLFHIASIKFLSEKKF